MGKRIAILRNFQRLLHERKSDIAALITREAGKPCVEALLTEVLVVLDAARFCTENAYGFLREQPLPHGNLAMKTKAGTYPAEPLRCDRDYFAVELSILHSRDGIAVRARDRECSGAEAIGTHFPDCAGTGVIAA